MSAKAKAAAASPSKATKPAEPAPARPHASLSVGKVLAVAGALLAAVLLVQAVRDPAFEPFDLNSEIYDLQPAKAPRMSGHALATVACLLELPLIGPFLQALLVKDNKFYLLRQFVLCRYTRFAHSPPAWRRPAGCSH